MKNKHARANHDGGLRKVGILTYNIVYKENHVKGIIDKKLESFVDGEVFFIRVVGGDVKVNRCKPEQNSECYHDCLI